MSIYVVGLGPGDSRMMTPQAAEAIARCEVVAGYDKYIRLIEDMLHGKAVISSGMRKEAERASLALEEARKGRDVAVVSSGDAGVYGMASLIFELAQPFPDIEITVVPGITAALSAAAVLGAPLSNDFAVISLSDLLTPWEVIEKRLISSAQGDFVVALYNPSSIKRHDYLQKAAEILARYKCLSTPCGMVRNIGRPGCESNIFTLAELPNKKADMFTTVIVGNSATGIINGRLVTIRGYRYGN